MIVPVRQVIAARTSAARRRRISLLLNEISPLSSALRLVPDPPFFRLLGAGGGEVGDGEHREGGAWQCRCVGVGSAVDQRGPVIRLVAR